MNIFNNFPEDTVCKICGTNIDNKCVLVPIDGTLNGNNMKAIPVHLTCILEGIMYNSYINMFYIKEYISHENTE